MASHFLLFSQNVGIGTAAPLDKLHVAGNVRIDPLAGIGTRLVGTNASGTLNVISAGTTGQVMTQTVGGPAWQAGSGWALLGNSGTVAATNFAGTIDNVDYVIRTFNTEKLRVLAGGNVGIGTAAPAYRLDLASGSFGFGNGNQRTETRNDAGLQGNAGAQSGAFETSVPVNYPVGANSWWHLIDSRHSNTGNNYAMQLSGSFFDQELYFRKTNNNAAQAWSRVLTSSNLSSLAWTTLGNAGTSAATNFAGTTDAVDYVIRTNSAEKMRVQSAGNVGIGTAAPAYKIDVQGGNGRINNNFMGDVGHGGNWAGFSHYLSANTTGYAVLAAFDGNYLFLNKQNTGGGYIGFRVGNNDVAVITNAGNMGIGTTTPAFRLDNVGSGGGNVDLRTTGRIWTNSTAGGIWPSDLQDCFIGNISTAQLGIWTSSVGWDAFNITKANGYIGIGTQAPSSRLHVVQDGDNIPVIYGVNTNTTGGTTSYGVRGECGSSGLGSAGVSGVSTNSGQNEIGVLGDYGLWGASIFGLAWAAAYTDMPTTRDYGVFGVVNYSTGTGVYGKNLNVGGTAYGMYCSGNFAVTNTKSASVPTTKGNQLVYSVESPGIWFEDLANGQLVNGQAHISLDPMFLETVFIDGSHPMHVFLQEQGDCNGLYFVADADGQGFSVKEKANGNSSIDFSYRVMAKRRFYQDHRFGVDANQPMEDNLSKAEYYSPTTTDPNEMRAFVEMETQRKEAMAAAEKAKKADQK